ncbi:MAG: ABC transporter permease, partial [Planctomycetales bacterium]|nr:ABC transporter permease [Planctomycetales bacterium]
MSDSHAAPPSPSGRGAGGEGASDTRTPSSPAKKNLPKGEGSSAGHYAPLRQLILARVREFYREPEAIFWVYGFPILMVVTLGIAFRDQPVEQIHIDIVSSPQAELIATSLRADPRFVVATNDTDICRRRLRTGKTAIVVNAKTLPSPSGSGDGGEGASPTDGYTYLFDPTRPDSLLARNAVDDVLQRAAGRRDSVAVTDEKFIEPGGRYVDFLVPGLLGMSLMGGGLWGVGFVTVDMRIRKLLKRFLATPMKKSHFLGGIMISRLLFLIPEVLILLLFSRLAFGVVIQGSVIAVLALILLGAGAFAGIGLLIASRAKTIEAVSGLMNLVMLPMWVLSGIFFSSDRFPEQVQPLVKLLPLTMLIDALRGVIQDGTSLAALSSQVLGLVVWGLVSFVLALRWFRW